MLLKTLVFWKFKPPSIEYVNGAIPPFAFIVIIPFTTLQSVGFVATTLATVGAAAEDNTIGADAGVKQVLFAFLINTV